MNAGDIVSYAEKRYAIRILLHIGDNPGCSMNDLAASIRGGIHTIRERVMEAESLGLISVDRAPRPHMELRIYLSPRGDAAVGGILKLMGSAEVSA